MKKFNEIKCIHRSFNFISKDDVHCADCGNKVLIYVPAHAHEAPYPAPLEPDPAGTSTTLRRAHRDQLKLTLALDPPFHATSLFTSYI